MDILAFIKEYWTQIIFICGLITTLFVLLKTSIDATKCSLRNDILEIYEKCKQTKTITLYQLEAIELSYALYKRLKGNSFVQAIVEEVRTYTRV